jgi:hypothetical protein
VTDVTLTDIFQYQSEFVDVTDVTLIDNFQYQSEFVDSDSITKRYGKKESKLQIKLECSQLWG